MARPSLNSNALYAQRYLQDKYKLKPFQAAGIVGNLMQESTFNTGARNAGDGRDGSDSVGIGQWNGDRARNLKAFAGDNLNSLDTQIDFVMHEMNGEKGAGAGSERYAYNQLMKAENVHDATAAMISFERPSGWSQKNPTAGHGFDNRLAWAGEVMGMSPEEIASAQPTVMRAHGVENQNVANASLVPEGMIRNPDAGKAYDDGLLSRVVNSDRVQPEFVKADKDGKAVERGLFEKITGNKAPESILGVRTSKGLDMLSGLGKAMSDNADSLNKQAQSAGGRRDTAPVELIQNPADIKAKQDQMQKLKPWQLLLAMNGKRGGLGGLGGIGRV